MRNAPRVALPAALFSGTALSVWAADLAPAPFGPPAGATSVAYHALWSTPNAAHINAPLTLDETITVRRGDDGSQLVLLGDKPLGTLDPTGKHMSRASDLGNASDLRSNFTHLVELMRAAPANITTDTTWQATYNVSDHGGNYEVPVDVSASVRDDVLHVSAQGHGGGTLVDRSGDSTILESADYQKGILQKASGHELTIMRWSGARNSGTSTDDITWSLETK